MYQKLLESVFYFVNEYIILVLVLHLTKNTYNSFDNIVS